MSSYTVYHSDQPLRFGCGTCFGDFMQPHVDFEDGKIQRGVGSKFTSADAMSSGDGLVVARQDAKAEVSMQLQR